MIIFTLFGMLVTASIAGLLWYKISEEQKDINTIEELNGTVQSWQDYKAQYIEPDYDDSLPMLCAHCESIHSDDQDYIICKDNYNQSLIN